MSAPRKRFDLVAGRKYTTRNGDEKTHWLNCGEAVEWDDGSITIQQRTVPVGGWFDGTLRLFERRERDAQPQRQVPAQQNDFDDSIPF
jgi:hypothetical protein